MKTVKKNLSLALVLAMVLSCLPMRAWAEETVPELPELEASVEKETAAASSIDNDAFYYSRNLSEIRFEGNAPGFGSNCFYYVNATAYDPAGEAAWTNEIFDANYGHNSTITWVPYEKTETPDTSVPGDVTGDDIVDDFDVAMLLWHVLFPDMYYVDDNADFNGDGSIDDTDVAYLLWHILFPTDYPL